VSYAAGTTVTVDRSKAEIERLLTRYGCSQFGSGWNNEGGQAFAHVTFRHGQTSIMLGLPMPPASDFMYEKKRSQWSSPRRRSKEAAETAYGAEVRRRWRALALVIKAKLEAVESGISTLEREFFSDVVLPNGSTLGQVLIPQLEALQSGRLLLAQNAGGKEATP